MKVAIIVFSPSGNTLKAAKLIEKSFVSRDAKVRLLNITAKKDIANQESIVNYLNVCVESHDLLFIGGPVYAGHLQNNVKKIIKALPLPDEKWAPLVVPFVTYGGVHSSIALKEAGALLKQRERKNIAGLKIAASHSLTQKFPFSINENMPGSEEANLIESMVERVYKIMAKEDHEIADVSSSFNYVSFGENLLYKLFSEKTFHKIMFGERVLDHEKCNGCGLCAKKCPMQIIELKKGKAEISENGTVACCYCAECYSKCKFDAISWDLSKSKKYLSHMKNKNKFESPQSAVYPI